MKNTATSVIWIWFSASSPIMSKLTPRSFGISGKPISKKSASKNSTMSYILLNHYPLDTEEKKRVLYVVMTQSKENLFIHTNSIHFPRQNIPALTYLEEHHQYSEPNVIILESGVKAIWLDFAKCF